MRPGSDLMVVSSITRCAAEDPRWNGVECSWLYLRGGRTTEEIVNEWRRVILFDESAAVRSSTPYEDICSVGRGRANNKRTREKRIKGITHDERASPTGPLCRLFKGMLSASLFPPFPRPAKNSEE